MLDRDTLIQIINSMDTGKLVTMLGSVGLQVGNPDEQMLEPEDKIEDWNLREVAVGPANKPQIFDKNKVIKIPTAEVRGEEPPYMDEEYEPQLEDYSDNSMSGMY